MALKRGRAQLGTTCPILMHLAKGLGDRLGEMMLLQPFWPYCVLWEGDLYLYRHCVLRQRGRCDCTGGNLRG